MTDTYRLVGDHVENLASGRMVAPGEYIDADALSSDDRWLLDEGRFIEAEKPTEEDQSEAQHEELVARAKTLGIRGRTKMGEDELRAAIEQAEKEADS